MRSALLEVIEKAELVIVYSRWAQDDRRLLLKGMTVKGEVLIEGNNAAL